MRIIILLIAFIFSNLLLQGQATIGTEKNLRGPVQRSTIGKVRKLFWKASIDNQVAMVSLADIEGVGIQEYAVDNAAYVRELTITLKSRNLVRIYHIEPRNSPSEYLNDVVENVTGRLTEVQSAAVGDSGQKVNAVIKSYPVTTHKEMIEYRVGNKQTINDLYVHLENALLDYHVAEVIEGQRPNAITEINVEKSDE